MITFIRHLSSSLAVRQACWQCLLQASNVFLLTELNILLCGIQFAITPQKKTFFASDSVYNDLTMNR